MSAELDETLPAPDRTATQSPDAARSTTALPAGRQLGHFRIERLLGAGGMGEVYLAHDLALDRPVAVKVLPPEVGGDRKRRERMVREARSQARVSHPNVAHIYFIGETDERLYFAMELVNGRSLADRLADGPLSVEQALAVVRGAVLGLREAQRQGITHRDVKPSNLMVDSHGMVKLLDFGLAASGEPIAGGVASGGAVEQTSLAGTPLYMAPEQARGEAVDFRTDIYALGATLYQLVTGKPPFQADSVDELVSLHASAARPKVARRGLKRTEISSLDDLCERMMAADPSERFASYDELLRAIELASAAHTRPGGLWARTIAAFVDLVMVTIVVGFVVFGTIALVLDRRDVSIGAGPISLAMIVYQTLCIARFGRSIGKWIVELEVVDVATGRRPRWPRALARSAIMFAPPALLDLLQTATDWQFLDIGAAALWFTLIVIVAFSVLYMPGKRTPWDRWTRTMVRYRTTDTALAAL